MIILDTHVLIWWVNADKRLSKKAMSAIKKELNNENGEILISSISAWEVAMLVEKERISLTMNVDDWLETVAEIEAVKFIPINNTIAVQSVALPGNFHSDPADRMIAALSRHLAIPVVTADEKIQKYKHVKTIW
ncbi:MAG: type II toxin-antitoxin system VapC family toxin [Pseudomonadota bacterium]|nr:type II toxin-antitoxin system VapC family toxin [Pseudomonadota bacterium]